MNSFKRRLIEAGVESSMLDSIVDEAASREASRINNEGMSDQLEYLERQGMTEGEIIDCLGLN